MVTRTGPQRKVRLARDETRASTRWSSGAGVIGLACAWRAAQRGLRVAVIDREAPGSGATRVAAGMLAPLGEASWGEEALLELNLASARLYPDFAAELEEASGAAVGYRRCGALHVALDRDEAEELRRRHELHVSLELDAQWLRPRECRELEPGLATAVAGGVHAPRRGRGRPGVPGRGAGRLRSTARASSLITGDEVVEALLRRRPHRRRANRERARAARRPHGARGGLVVGARRRGCPRQRARRCARSRARSSRCAAPPAEPLCEGIVATQWVYVVPRADGRVVVGATVEERGADLTVTAGGVHELLREAYRVLPDVAELELAGAFAGLRPTTPDNAPVIGHGASRGSCSRRATTATGSCSRRSPPTRSPRSSRASRRPRSAEPLGAERFEEVASR